jgi:hypothetical protein
MITHVRVQPGRQASRPIEHSGHLKCDWRERGQIQRHTNDGTQGKELAGTGPSRRGWFRDVLGRKAAPGGIEVRGGAKRGRRERADISLVRRSLGRLLAMRCQFHPASTPARPRLVPPDIRIVRWNRPRGFRLFIWECAFGDVGQPRSDYRVVRPKQARSTTGPKDGVASTRGGDPVFFFAAPARPQPKGVAPCWYSRAR